MAMSRRRRWTRSPIWSRRRYARPAICLGSATSWWRTTWTPSQSRRQNWSWPTTTTSRNAGIESSGACICPWRRCMEEDEGGLEEAGVRAGYGTAARVHMRCARL